MPPSPYPATCSHSRVSRLRAAIAEILETLKHEAYDRDDGEEEEEEEVEKEKESEKQAESKGQ
jgi:hypothetical protein